MPILTAGIVLTPCRPTTTASEAAEATGVTIRNTAAARLTEIVPRPTGSEAMHAAIRCRNAARMRSSVSTGKAAIWRAIAGQVAASAVEEQATAEEDHRCSVIGAAVLVSAA